MRHRNATKKLGRTSSHRRAMLRNMVTSLFRHEKITTTDAKAKVLRSVAEKMITLGKKGSLHARRKALAFIRDTAVAAKVFDELSDRYRERAGGYTRIMKKAERPGDNALLSVIELIPAEGKTAEKAGVKKEKKATQKPVRRSQGKKKTKAPETKTKEESQQAAPEAK
ncbi:MAG: 50S ribosomal protein L17 [Deltaproteobacteria bacterium]|nr:50S ribosomal protein L17 [Deltaproteobacteria bacterium]